MNISSYVHAYTVQSFQNIHVSSRCVDFRGINRIYGVIDSVYHNKLHDKQQFLTKITKKCLPYPASCVILDLSSRERLDREALDFPLVKPVRDKHEFSDNFISCRF